MGSLVLVHPREPVGLTLEHEAKRLLQPSLPLPFPRDLARDRAQRVDERHHRIAGLDGSALADEGELCGLGARRKRPAGDRDGGHAAQGKTQRRRGRKPRSMAMHTSTSSLVSSCKRPARPVLPPAPAWPRSLSAAGRHSSAPRASPTLANHVGAASPPGGHRPVQQFRREGSYQPGSRLLHQPGQSRSRAFSL